MRKKTTENEVTKFDEGQMFTLVKDYFHKNSEIKDLKHDLDLSNKVLKEQLAFYPERSFEKSGYFAKVTVSETAKLNEEKLLSILKESGLSEELNLVKTKEYVDLDALESAIYHNDIPEEIMDKISECNESKKRLVLNVKYKGE